MRPFSSSKVYSKILWQTSKSLFQNIMGKGTALRLCTRLWSSGEMARSYVELHNLLWVILLPLHKMYCFSTGTLVVPTSVGVIPVCYFKLNYFAVCQVYSFLQCPLYTFYLAPFSTPVQWGDAEGGVGLCPLQLLWFFKDSLEKSMGVSMCGSRLIKYFTFECMRQRLCVTGLYCASLLGHGHWGWAGSV